VKNGGNGHFEVVQTEAALGAEVFGLDLRQPVSDEVRDLLLKCWFQNMVLLFRDQDLSDEDILSVAEVFGGQQVAGSRAFFLKAGFHAGQHIELRSTLASVWFRTLARTVSQHAKLRVLEAWRHSGIPTTLMSMYLREAPCCGQK